MGLHVFDWHGCFMPCGIVLWYDDSLSLSLGHLVLCVTFCIVIDPSPTGGKWPGGTVERN